MSDGAISPNFRWEASGRTDAPEELLASEGIVFTDGRADPAQRIRGVELAGLLGMDLGDLPGAGNAGDTEPDTGSAARHQFTDQLAAKPLGRVTGDLQSIVCHASTGSSGSLRMRQSKGCVAISP